MEEGIQENCGGHGNEHQDRNISMPSAEKKYH